MVFPIPGQTKNGKTEKSRRRRQVALRIQKSMHYISVWLILAKIGIFGLWLTMVAMHVVTVTHGIKMFCRNGRSWDSAHV